MNIRIIRNAQKLKGNVYNGNFILEREFEPSEYEGINLIRYYLYDADKNEKTELLADKKKYDILKVKTLNKASGKLYFSAISDEPSDNKNITLYRYDVESETLETLYRYSDDISQYSEYKRIRVFILNEFYLLLQNEYVRYNLTETYKGYFEFEQYLYCIKEDKLVVITDENLRTNGIESIKLLKNNMCVIKTGYNLLQDERYKKLSKSEASYEKISFVNLGQFVSEVLLMQKDIMLDTIDQAYYTETFAYIAVKGNYIVYSKFKINDNEEEVIFYDYETKKTMLCINKNVYGIEDLAQSYIIGNVPYIRLTSQTGTQFYNLISNQVDIKFPENVVVETVVNDMFIVSGKRKQFIGKEKNTVAVYRYPDKELLHQEKGNYIGCIAKNKANVYILID